MSVDQIPTSTNNEVDLTNGTNSTQTNPTNLPQNIELIDPNHNDLIQSNNNEETGDSQINIEEELEVYQKYLKEYQNYYTSINLQNKQSGQKINEEEKFKDSKEFIQILQDPTVPIQVALNRFKKQIIAEGENNLEGLLSSYLNQSPNCSELILTWEICKTTSEATDLDNELVDLFSLILNNIHSSPNHHLGIKIYKEILEKFSKLLQIYLTNNFPKLNKSVFDLLTNINKFGYSATREVFNNFNLTTKEVMNHAIPSKNSASKPEYRNRLLQLRKSYINFCLSFFKFGDQDIKLKVLELKDFLIQIFKGLEFDNVTYLKEIFSIFFIEVGVNPYLKRITKFRFFNRYLIQQVTNLFSKTQLFNLTETEKTSPAQLAYEFLRDVCSKPGIGICFHDFGYYHPSTFKLDFPKGNPKMCVLNGALLDLLVNLRPVTQPYEQKLSLDILKACPELINYNWQRKELNLDPRLSSTWLGSITWLQKVINLPLTKWEGNGRTPIKTDLTPDTLTIVNNILPIYFTSKIQLKGLNNESSLIKYTTLNALVTILRKFNNVLDSIDERILKLKGEGRKAHNWEDLKREVSIEVRKRLIQPQPIMQLYFKLQSSKTKETMSAAQIWLMNQTLLRILRYLYYLIPESLLIEKWQLHKNFPSNFYQLTKSNQSLFISLLKYYPNFIWWRHPNKKGEEFSPLTQLLYLQFTTNNMELKFQSEALNKKFLGESILFDHDNQEILIWLNCLNTLFNSNLEFLDNQNIFRVIETGLNQAMTYRFKYLDQLTQKFNDFNLANGIENGGESSNLPFSPLLLALEFWYFELFNNNMEISNKGDLRLSYIKLQTNLICQLANLSNHLDFIKYYYSEWRSKILTTLEDGDNIKLINYWLNGTQNFINSKYSSSMEIEWETYNGASINKVESVELIELINSGCYIWDETLIEQLNTLLITIFNQNDNRLEQCLVNLITLRYPYSGNLFNLKNLEYWLSIDKEQGGNGGFCQNLLKLINLLPFNFTLSITSSDAFSNLEFFDIIQQSLNSLNIKDKLTGKLVINGLISLLVKNFNLMKLTTLKNLIQLINFTIDKFGEEGKLELLGKSSILGLFFDLEWCKFDNHCKTLINSYLIELLISIDKTTNSIEELKNNYSDKLKLTILNWLENPLEINLSAVILTSKSLKLLELKDLKLITKHLLKKHSILINLPLEFHHTLIDLISRTLNSDLFDKGEKKGQLVKVLEDYLTRISGSNITILDDFFKLKLIKKLIGYSDNNGIQLNLLKTNDYLSKLKLPKTLLELVINTVYKEGITLNSYKLQLLTILLTIPSNSYKLINNLVFTNLKEFKQSLIDYSGSIDNILDFINNWLNYYSINSKLTGLDKVLEWNEVGINLIQTIFVKLKGLELNSIGDKVNEFFRLSNVFAQKLTNMNYTSPNLNLQLFYSESITNPRILYTLNLIFDEDSDLKFNTIDTLTQYFNNFDQLESFKDLTSSLIDTVKLIKLLVNYIKFNELESKSITLINLLLPILIQKNPSELASLIEVLTELVGKDQLTIKNQLDFILNKLLPKTLDSWQLNYKSDIINCLRVISKKFKLNSSTIWDSELLDRLRLLFSGTSSEGDIFLLKLMSNYELIQDVSLQLDNVLWGQSVLKYPKWEVNAMLTAGSLVEVSMNQLVTYKVSNTIKLFDPNLPLEDFDYKPNYYQRDEVYDLRFILPLIGSWFYLKKQVNLSEFIQKNLLGVLVISTSSKINQVRQVAYQLLDEFISLVQKATPKTLREKSQIIRLIESLAVLVKERKEGEAPPRLPSGVCQFASQALLVILKPDHPIFLTLSKFLMSPYPFNYQTLPMIATLIENFNSRENSQQILNWYLTWLPSSFRQNSDFRLIKNSNLIPSLISFSLSSRSSPQIKRKLLSLIFELSKVPNVLSNLLIEEGILSYLQSNITSLNKKLLELGQNTQLILLDLIGNYNTLFNLILNSKVNLLLINNNQIILLQLLFGLTNSFEKLAKVQVLENNYWELLNVALILTKFKNLIVELVGFSGFNSNNFRDFDLVKNQLNLTKVCVKGLIFNLIKFSETNSGQLPKVNNRFKNLSVQLNFNLISLECWEFVHYLHNDKDLILKFLDFSWYKF